MKEQDTWGLPLLYKQLDRGKQTWNTECNSTKSIDSLALFLFIIACQGKMVDSVLIIPQLIPYLSIFRYTFDTVPK